DEVRAFLADKRPSRTKREALVERLIGSEDYVEHWTNRWADLLLVNGKFLGAEGAAAYRDWIRTAVSETWPYDRFARELSTAAGSTRDVPAASYFKALRTPEQIAETTTQVFLGVRFNCNKCHDHPFERWTQDDYYGWAALFADVRLRKDPASGERTIPGSAVEQAQPLYEIVDDVAGGVVRHDRTGATAAARFPYPAGEAGAGGPTLRRRAAEWLASPDNRYFAASYVNRVWGQMTGAGLIEPVDDIRAGNPPTNPELLEWLTREFIAHGFDHQWLLRTICQSRTYQLSPEANPWNADDNRNYARALPRRLSAESLYDAVHRAVGSTARLPGLPPGARAASLPDALTDDASGLLGQLGRPARESGCECERTNDLPLGPVMALVNGPTFAAAIDDPDSALAQLVAAAVDDQTLVEEVFFRVLNRAPTAAETSRALEFLAAPRTDAADVAAELAARRESLAPGFVSWREANRPVAGARRAAALAPADDGAALEAQPDGSLLAAQGPEKATYEIVAAAPLERIQSLRLEVLADERLPARGPGRADNGNFVLTQIRLFAVTPDRPDQRRRLKLRSAEADYSQAGYHVSGAIDAKPETGWAVAGATGRDHAAAFELARPLSCPAGTSLVVELDQQYGARHTIGRLRLSASDETGPLLRPEHPAQWSELLAVAPDELAADDEARLRDYFFSLDGRYADLLRAEQLVANPRLAAVQDLAWALINSPAFLFNH
ncbi:MAG TPA: DUF1553 domain-containing protein, partial [Lacipirellulaceae bacterium]|nr:DUF1553 domain-containing protein [Lacipirellulaceae bacterium]